MYKKYPITAGQTAADQESAHQQSWSLLHSLRHIDFTELKSENPTVCFTW